MSRSHLAWAWLPLCLGACSEPAQPTPPRSDPWSNQEEVLHQTREVIRYVDEQQRLKLEQLRELGVDPAAPAQNSTQQQSDPQGAQH